MIKSITDFFRLIPAVYEKKQWPKKFLKRKQMLEFVLMYSVKCTNRVIR